MTEGADIQVENGEWFKLHNRIAEALYQAPLSSSELRCVLYLLRETYGWKRKSVAKKFAEIAEDTGLKLRTVRSAMDNLRAKNVVIATGGKGRSGFTWQFNKYVENWNFDSCRVTSQCHSTESRVTEKCHSTDASVTSQCHSECHKNVTLQSSAKDSLKTTPKDSAGGIGDTEMHPDSAHRNGRKQYSERIASEFQQLKDDAGLTPKQFNANCDALLNATKLKAIVDAGDDRRLRDAQRATTLLAKLGYGTPGLIAELHDAWYQRNQFRSDPTPSLANLTDFAGRHAEEQAPPINVKIQRVEGDDYL